MVTRNLKNILRESFWMAIDAIRKNKLRSILTLLGITIGVFSVIGVMTAIRTLEDSVESGLNVFAANTFVVQKYPEIQFGRPDKKYRNRKNITIDQYKKLKARAKLPLLVSAADGTGVRNVKYRNREVKKSVELFGGDDGTVGNGGNGETGLDELVGVTSPDEPIEDVIGDVIIMSGGCISNIKLKRI